MNHVTTIPLLAADLTFVKVNGGRAYADLVNWEQDSEPTVGQHVLAADGGSERMAAVIIEIREDGTIVLSVPAHAAPLRVAG